MNDFLIFILFILHFEGGLWFKWRFFVNSLPAILPHKLIVMGWNSLVGLLDRNVTGIEDNCVVQGYNFTLSNAPR